MKLEPPANGHGHGTRSRLGRHSRLDVEEREQVRQIQALLEHLRQREENPLDQVAALPERPRQERQRADREPAQYGQIDRHGVGAVVAERAERDEHGGHDVPLDRQTLVGVVKLVGEPGVPAHQEAGQVEQLDLFGHLVGGARVAQVVEQPPLRRPLEQERVAQRRVVRLAEKRRHDRHHQEEQQPGELHRQHGCEGDERDEVLRRGQQQRDEPDPPHRLAACPLQVVVRLGILVLREVERRGVLHESHTDTVREQIAEQALEQRREARQAFAPDGDGELEPHEAAE